MFKIVILVMVFVCCSLAERVTYNGYKTFAVTAKTDFQLKQLRALYTTTEHYDFFKEPIGLNQEIAIMSPPMYIPTLMNYLKTHGIYFRVQVEDVEKLVQKSYEEVGEVETKGLEDNPIDWNNFITLQTVNAYIDYLTAHFSTLVETIVIGKTLNNNELRVLKVGNGPKAIWIDSAIHAREWITVTTTTWFVNNLLANRHEKPELLTNLTWYFLFVHNPDGYNRSHVVDRYHRKNMNLNNLTNPGRGCLGVDVNRNFLYKFGGSGTSGSACSQIYRGAYGFSELESQAVFNFIYNHRRHLKAVFSIHSYGQYWMFPWGYTKTKTSQHSYLMEVAVKGAACLKRQRGTTYKVGDIGNTIYVAAGNTLDSAFALANVTLSYTLELPGTDFVIDKKYIKPIANETYDGIECVAYHVIQNVNTTLV